MDAKPTGFMPFNNVRNAPLHVVAGVVHNPAGEILIAKRPNHVHQGELWEFPGGKRELGERPHHTLQRELAEEVGIEVLDARPLIQVHHDYGDRHILLDVWQVETWQGTAYGREGQSIQWCAIENLRSQEFLAANLSILQAVELPPVYTITPEPETCRDFWAELEQTLHHGARLIQLRAKSLDIQTYTDYARAALARCTQHGARLLLNADPGLVAELGAHGVHLDSTRLKSLSARPLSADFLVAASCHNATELAQAHAIGANFALLSPVRATRSHPDTPALGWKNFTSLLHAARCPVYALGGLQSCHLPLAWAHGAQGIAAIRGVWGNVPTPGTYSYTSVR